jgi:hypothetical protein
VADQAIEQLRAHAHRRLAAGRLEYGHDGDRRIGRRAEATPIDGGDRGTGTPAAAAAGGVAIAGCWAVVCGAAESTGTTSGIAISGASGAAAVCAGSTTVGACGSSGIGCE